MSGLGNKEVMAKNIRYYMEKRGLNAKDFSIELDFKYSTVLDWLNAKTYPRIDKIEMMANYFNIEKSDLVEDKDKEKENIDISIMVNDLIENLNSNQTLMYKDEPMDELTKELVKTSIEQAARIAMARHKDGNGN
jgi:repressor protein|nr:MAG TPA: Repressor protein CI [Caudoviricetes sp.]DAX84161.1 MAG TPA: Repressor protein CI [Caudoviricetes sp.]